MQTYFNLSGRSSVSHYEFCQDYIDVRFSKTGKDGNNTYRYTNETVTSSIVTHMKELAKTGIGLGGFIQSNVRDNYSKKWYLYA